MNCIYSVSSAFTYSEFQRGEIQPLSKKSQNFFVHLIKQKRKLLLADLRKSLSSNQYYNSHIAFWHDFGDNRKNIYRLCYLLRKTCENANSHEEKIMGERKRTGFISACPHQTWGKFYYFSLNRLDKNKTICYNM